MNSYFLLLILHKQISMKKHIIFLLFTMFSLGVSAQEADAGENSSVVETKVGACLNWNFGKEGQYLLSPSLRSVHNNRKEGSEWTGYRGMAAELYFSMPLLKYLQFFADVELDLNREAASHLTFFTGVGSSYSFGRFSVYGEFRYSSDRSLNYIDADRSPYFKYKINGGVWILEDIWKLTLQATLPHSLSQNAITGISVEGISQFTLGAHFGLKCSFEWSDTFAFGQNYFCPQLTAVFNI